MNDIELFNYILNDYRITNEFFSEIIVVDGFGYGTDFIYNILNNHMYRITKESKIIKLCLENNIENDVFLFSASSLSEVLIDELYKENKNNCELMLNWSEGNTL